MKSMLLILSSMWTLVAFANSDEDLRNAYSDEVQLFCEHTQKHFEQSSIQIDWRHCLNSKKVRVYDEQFWNTMTGPVVLVDSKGQKKKVMCEVVYGGLPSDRDFWGPAKCN